MFALIRSAFDALAGYLGYTRDRQALKNAEDMKAAKKAQEECDAKSKVEEAIRKRNLDALRKELGE